MPLNKGLELQRTRALLKLTPLMSNEPTESIVIALLSLCDSVALTVTCFLNLYFRLRRPNPFFDLELCPPDLRSWVKVFPRALLCFEYQFTGRFLERFCLVKICNEWKFRNLVMLCYVMYLYRCQNKPTWSVRRIMPRL